MSFVFAYLKNFAKNLHIWKDILQDVNKITIELL